jgi:hypothetical protein
MTNIKHRQHVARPTAYHSPRYLAPHELAAALPSSDAVGCPATANG